MIKTNIGELVAHDYRVAHVFKNHKIDFYCKGKRNILEVAEQNNLDPALLIKEVESVVSPEKTETTDFKSWHLDLLANYIEKKHHRYAEEKIPVLKEHLEKLCQGHGQDNPELFKIKEHFNTSSGELAMHMKKEELLVFPAVRKMFRAKHSGTPMTPLKFETIQNPIKTMMRDHDDEGERFREIDRLSNNYTPPEGAGNSYHLAFSLLKEFEEDLHMHIHLENNILFPKSEELEKELAGTH